MSKVTIENLSKVFPSKPPATAVDDVSLAVEEGEMLVLLGPSGCGKTTTLRCLAGLETPSEGRITFGDRPVYDKQRRIAVPPGKRDIGMVFQSYALWPHLTVEENIAYPLRVRKMREALGDGWVAKVAHTVDCEHLLHRYPSELSGGQQQRIALARGLVAQPAVILFDEPLSNLDARLRDQLRGEIHELHRRLRFTGVYVTHDQMEALAIADRIVIMRAGRIEQIGVPSEIFERPATEYVADFVGVVNRLGFDRHDGDWVSQSGTVKGGTEGLKPSAVSVRLRPDDVSLATDLPASAPGLMAVSGARVLDYSYVGRHFDVIVQLGEERIRVRTVGKPPCDRGDEAHLVFHCEDALQYDIDGHLVAS